MIIITSGQKYTDIDALASALAYQNLSLLKNRAAKVVLPGPLNQSVPPSLRQKNLDFDTELRLDPNNCQFVVVDISEPKHFAAFVKTDKIIKIFDHRFWGHERFWREKLGFDAVIELTGACATLIWEEFAKDKLEQKIEPYCANLLSLAIISNTLNLKASVSTPRDQNALNSLKSLITLPKNWPQNYFDEVAQEVFKDPQKALENDTKIQEIRGQNFAIAQIELWDSRKFIEIHLDRILNSLNSLNTPISFLTSPSILEGRNYLVTENEEVKRQLSQTLGAKFIGKVGTTPKLFLRKEIIKILSEAERH